MVLKRNQWKALELYQEAYQQIYNRTKDDQTLALADICERMASCYVSLGKNGIALDWLTRALSVRELCQGKAHVDLAHTLTRISAVLRNAAQYHTAQDFTVRALHTLQSTVTHYSTLQHTAAHCSTLQYTAPHCNTLHRTATHSKKFYSPIYTKLGFTVRVLQHTATHCNTLHHTAMHCNTMQDTATSHSPIYQARLHGARATHTATHCNTLQHTATQCNTLQHTATYCNILQHTATYCNILQHTAIFYYPTYQIRLHGARAAHTATH